MPRHIPRSHLRSHPTTLSSVCGSYGGDKSNILSRRLFLESSNRCQRCDRIANGKPAAAGRKSKQIRRYPIVLSGLSMDALNWLEQLAADGEAGETIGKLVDKCFKENQRGH